MSVPDLDYTSDFKLLQKEIPDVRIPSLESHFHLRCQFRQDICKIQKFMFEKPGQNLKVVCHFQ